MRWRCGCDAANGVDAVAFEIGLAFEGVVDRFVELPDGFE
jgi:hypothetical protein